GTSPRRTRSPSPRSASSLHPVQAHFLEHLAAFGPVLVDLHMQEQVYRHAELLAQLLARRFADLADACAALAQHDAFLAVAGDHDLLADLDAAVLPVGVAFGPHG